MPDTVSTLGTWLFLTPVGFSFVLLLALMSVIWVFSYRIKRLDFVDVVWGMGFITVTLTAFLWRVMPGSFDGGQPFVSLTPRFIVCLLVIVWAVRLSLHILQRWLRRDSEDVRYQQLRRKWKGHIALNSYVRIFLLQTVLIYTICLPVLIITLVDPPADGLLVIGSAVWLCGFMVESISDWQLAQFAKKPENKGRLMTTGLWKYSRHPNYFGEVTQWWGIGIIGMSLALFSPFYALLILPSPILITILILRISGVPLTEKLMSKRDGWSDYAYRTSKFLPLPPKKG